MKMGNIKTNSSFQHSTISFLKTKTMDAAKVKADELVEKFSEYTFGHYVEWENIPSRKIYNATQCAIICAENCLKTAQWYAEKFGLKYAHERIDFWNEVLEHLKKKL